MIIPARFNGPAGSANGGYACGLVAELIDGPAEVTLRVPPPLDTPLSVVREAATIRVYAGTTLVAQARPVDPPAERVPSVTPAEAAQAARAYAGLSDHPFPTCYVCGPRRPADDGLRIYPGPLPDGRTAATFTAPAEASAVTAWAALDCPGGWTVLSNAGAGSAASHASGSDTFAGRPYVLGRMAAEVAAVPAPGEVCVVVGRCDEVRGRKALVATSLYGPDGALLATARATWIAVDVEGVAGVTVG